MNKALDKALFKPASKAYGAVAPGVVATGVDNFANNLSLPGVVVNDLLQFKIGDAFHNTFRFALNSTVGLGGLIDVAGQNKLNARPTDFGETLFVWGVPEGTYVEMPVFGPSTQRDAFGFVVDFAFDPANSLIGKKQRQVGTAAKILKKADDRNKFSGLVESVLYDSEDSYAQSRLLYLQSRRRELHGGIDEQNLEDPYAN